jgi:hypothetical protein
MGLWLLSAISYFNSHSAVTHNNESGKVSVGIYVEVWTGGSIESIAYEIHVRTKAAK